jgi:hypothetical protein
MRNVSLLIASTFFACGLANAKTYQLAFTGKSVKKPPGCSGTTCSGISGADQLGLVFAGPTKLPANQCSSPLGNGWSLVSFTDGVNTLASLEAAGWTISSVDLSVCTDSTGKKVVSWSADFDLLFNYPSADYNAYSASTSSTAHPGEDFPGNFYYAIQIQDVVNGNLAGVAEDWNATKPGSWKLSKVP